MRISVWVRTCSIYSKNLPFGLSLARLLNAKGLKHEIPLGTSNQENRTFSKLQFLPEIFHWDDAKSRVTFASRLESVPGGGGGGYTSEFLVGMYRPVPQILTQFQTKIFHFPHPFSDRDSKIHTRFQTFVGS